MTDLIDRMAEVLQEVSGDLEAEIAARYSEAVLAYPVMQQQKARDMDPVRRAKSVLALYEMEKEAKPLEINWYRLVGGSNLDKLIDILKSADEEMGKLA